MDIDVATNWPEEPTPEHWVEMDTLWKTFSDEYSVARGSDGTRELRMDKMTREFDEIDSWWSAYTTEASSEHSPANAEVFGLNELASDWQNLDKWWDSYKEVGNETAQAIRDSLETLNQKWENSQSHYDTDPLAADLTRTRYSRGPLQPSKEVDWSRWLGQLLYSSDALVRELFDVNVSEPPEEVTREARLYKEDRSYRRPDVILCHREQGISIEVKLEDENYHKARETAQLIEKYYPQLKWRHTLLLPEWKREVLEAKLDTSLRSGEGGRIEIGWEDPRPIEVIHWRDVTTAIRSVLRRGVEADDHWSANAYLFCAVAEQQLIGFQPQPVVERLAEPTDIVDENWVIEHTATLTEQLNYIQETLDS